MSFFLRVSVICLVLWLFTEFGHVRGVRGATPSAAFLAQHLGTHTPYPLGFTSRALLEKDNDFLAGNLNKEPLEETPPPKSCSLVYLQHVSRHGTRFPSTGNLKVFVALEEALNLHASSLNTTRFPFLLNWKNPYTKLIQGDISPSGSRELFDQGVRLAERFPSLFNTSYLPKLFDVQTTASLRTSQSAFAFMAGLFHANASDPLHSLLERPFAMWSSSAEHDRKLRFFKNCPKYKSETPSQNPQSEEYAQEKLPLVMKRLAEKLGGNSSSWLNPTLVKAFFDACAFDFALNHKTDQWCTLFDEEDILELEFIDDLETYYESGYGNQINFQMACPLLRDIMDIFESKAKDASQLTQRAHFRFAHAETLMPLISLLGLFKDSDPSVMSPQAPHEKIAQRQWRSALFSSFSANLVFLLYKCDNTHKIRVLSNEREVKLPPCDDVYCDLTTFLKAYESEGECPFEEICGIDDPNKKLKLLKRDKEHYLIAAYALGGFSLVVLLVLIILSLYVNSLRKRLGDSLGMHTRLLGSEQEQNDLFETS